MSTEKATQKAVIDYLTLKRHFFWRNNSGAMVSEYKGRQRFMRFGTTGSPDIFVLKNGMLYGLEIKDIKGKQSEGQVLFENDMNRHGGIYKVIRTLDDVIGLGL